MSVYSEIFALECQSFHGLRVRDESGIIPRVARRKKSKDKEMPVFDSIRKPTAPPSRKFGSDAPIEKLRPSLRKVKHKKDPATDQDNGTD